MQYTGLNELREKFLSFFEGKNHTRLKSASLIPHGDNSLLLINSGMAPLKKFFTGQETPPNVRVTTCQKCIRTPDIERVGKTSRHGTYFEMLGNFSFGDYFKEEATAWAWEFFTEVLEIPGELLYVSVYKEDDEAYDIWTKKRGVDPSHMVRLGKEDNFWEHGSGPCGPCSEIYFDRGEDKGCGSPDCKAGCDCDRFVEIWNLVFTQFNSDGNNHYEPLAKKNIDTGMGLERLACVMQGVDNLFEVDTVQNIMKHISGIAGIEYKMDEKSDISLRVITDHIRSTVFMVGDGVTGSNAGRGYVLRRLLRRAARHGRLLGITKPFLYEVAGTVIKENESAYPELAQKKDYIGKLIKNEEEAFAKTVGKGMELLSAKLDGIIKNGEKVLSGDDVFLLSDTYGFPFDLTVEIAEEKGISVDEKRYTLLLNEQKQKAREDHKNKSGSSWEEDGINGNDSDITVFTGYEHLEETAVIIAIYVNGEKTGIANVGEEAVIILDRTPFYAESGGQAGDSGVIEGSISQFQVTAVKKTGSGHILHTGIAHGAFTTGETVTASADKNQRTATMRNHTAAHLLQAALRKVLGDHVHQAGQLVDADRVRFDFSHFEAVSADELNRIEKIINENIMDALPVITTEMPVDEAKKLGAMALFGEKYGDTVRVVSIEDTSLELCGGTHVDNTAKIGLFRILSENSVAAGIRRIEGVTGAGVLTLIDDYKNIITKSVQALKASGMNELVSKCGAAASELKTLEKEINELNEKIAAFRIGGLLDKAVSAGNVRVVSAVFNDIKTEVLRSMGDKIKAENPDIVALLCSLNENGGSILCVCGKDAVSSGAHSGRIVQKISALTGGKGGGRPDSAMAGIGDKSKVDEALSTLTETVEELIR